MITIKADKLQDGLYNIKNGKIFKYKAKGGTVRTYEMGEIVRCKGCKHRYVSGNGTTQYYVCDFMDAQYEEDGFCHHGESEVEE